ncbi:hypothetical protein [Noviherbaspirillum autotrophicum]|uniref:hypothetical protein n=1 Tax=Noviherbaspirillum autotrophicum TaxID=709839 RepID=UPI001E3E84BE|nr:hypothetical protein [Noviherbaspirillum autotrophicum]
MSTLMQKHPLFNNAAAPPDNVAFTGASISIESLDMLFSIASFSFGLITPHEPAYLRA